MKFQKIRILLILGFLAFLPPAFAEDDWRKVLSDAQKDLGEGNLDSAEEGFRRAERLLEQAKASDSTELKKFGFSLIDCLVGIARVKDRKGEIAESEAVYEMAIETLKKFCENGWKNQEYADYLPGIAELYDRHGKAQQADGAFKRLIEIRTTVAPKDDNKIIAAYESYSKFLRAQSRADEAVPLENKVSQMKYGNNN